MIRVTTSSTAASSLRAKVCSSSLKSWAAMAVGARASPRVTAWAVGLARGLRGRKTAATAGEAARPNAARASDQCVMQRRLRSVWPRRRRLSSVSEDTS